MRRAFLAVTLGGVLLTGAACDGDAKPAAIAASATPVPAPTVSSPDYTTDTRKVCAQVKKVFDNDIKPFGSALGKMVLFKEEQLAKEAAESEKAARKQLRTIAAKIIKATQDAQDPAVVMAGKASAAKFTRSAGDAKLYDSVKSTKDLNRLIDTKVGDWLTPISGYCA